jgi:prophage tail gpP-like protein
MPTPLPNAEDLSIKSAGQTLGGWTMVRVSRSVEAYPSQFMVQLTERYPGQASKIVLTPGVSCTVSLGRDLVITGYIDRVMATISAAQHDVVIIGRSKTEDLVDSSIFGDEIGGWVFQATGMIDAATRLAKTLRHHGQRTRRRFQDTAAKCISCQPRHDRGVTSRNARPHRRLPRLG